MNLSLERLSQEELHGLVRKLLRFFRKNTDLSVSQRNDRDSCVLVHGRRQEQQSRAIDMTGNRSRCINRPDQNSVVQLEAILFAARLSPFADYAIPLKSDGIVLLRI